MSKPKLGTGARFKQLMGRLEKKGTTNAAALAAWIGRRKYGKRKFQKLAKKGRMRKSGGGRGGRGSCGGTRQFDGSGPHQ